MNTSTMSLVTAQRQPENEGDPFDLDISFIESGPIIPELLRSTSDNCGQTCQSACNSCQS
jgi:FxLD family lantipeptide